MIKPNRFGLVPFSSNVRHEKNMSSIFCYFFFRTCMGGTHLGHTWIYNQNPFWKRLKAKLLRFLLITIIVYMYSILPIKSCPPVRVLCFLYLPFEFLWRLLTDNLINFLKYLVHFILFLVRSVMRRSKYFQA